MLFDKITAAELVKRYNHAVKNNLDVFTFQEGELLTRYAYYLIQHLKNEKLISGKYDGKTFRILQNN